MKVYVLYEKVLVFEAIVITMPNPQKTCLEFVEKALIKTQRCDVRTSKPLLPHVIVTPSQVWMVAPSRIVSVGVRVIPWPLLPHLVNFLLI